MIEINKHFSEDSTNDFDIKVCEVEEKSMVASVLKVITLVSERGE